MIPAVLLIVALGAAAIGCRGSAPPAGGSTHASDPALAGVAGYRVEGVTCSSCAKRLREGVMKVDGVKSVEVDVGGKHVSIDYDGGKTDPDRIRAEIEALGFKALRDETKGAT